MKTKNGRQVFNEIQKYYVTASYRRKQYEKLQKEFETAEGVTKDKLYFELQELSQEIKNLEQIRQKLLDQLYVEVESLPDDLKIEVLSKKVEE